MCTLICAINVLCFILTKRVELYLSKLRTQNITENPSADGGFNTLQITWNGVGQAGTEATLCYMAKADNRALLQTFGFSIAGYTYDRIRLSPAATLPGGGICKVS